MKIEASPTSYPGYFLDPGYEDEASHAFYNLVNCMSPYFYAYT
jgi:hypothetical protein